MGYEAINAVEEAFEDTKELLLPFNLRTWSKLALIAVLAGGAGGSNFPSMPSGGSEYDPGTGSSDFSDLESSFDPDFSNNALGAFSSRSGNTVIVLVAFLLIAALLALMYVSSVFEFIYYKSLIENRVEITSNFRENTGKGFRLFVFRFLWTVFLISLLGIGIALIAWWPVSAIPIILLAIPFAVATVIIGVYVNTFVILKMLETDKGFYDSAKSIYPDLKMEWKEFALFVFMNTALGMAVSIFVGMGALAVLFVLGIPLAIIGILLYLVNWILVIPVVVIGIMVFILVVLIGLVAPTSTFIYYYSIEVYHSLTS